MDSARRFVEWGIVTWWALWVGGEGEGEMTRNLGWLYMVGFDHVHSCTIGLLVCMIQTFVPGNHQDHEFPSSNVSSNNQHIEDHPVLCNITILLESLERDQVLIH
jgi:hypothetical protein